MWAHLGELEKSLGDGRTDLSAVTRRSADICWGKQKDVVADMQLVYEQKKKAFVNWNEFTDQLRVAHVRATNKLILLNIGEKTDV